ncbi:scavenger receptor class B member 1-like [Periplaneta americana]|uniref:scavenger receptor class B member 1-like n=1 Tax=Periplaneta americana TaxID=6978 RepID=UPI0037E79A44
MKTFSKLLCWSEPASEKKKKAAQPPANKGVVTYIACGVLSLIVGCLGLIWSPSEVLMTERLRMRRGFPPFEWWVTPPEEVFVSFYVFNVSNYEQFLNGSHSKLRLQEVGPYVFKEVEQHTNVEHNGNDTLTYKRQYKVEFVPELNTLNLNDTVVIPNLALLGMASYLADSSFIIKLGFNLLMRRMGSQPFKRVSVYDYMWNLTDPLLLVGHKLAPFLVPVDNLGILDLIYSNLVDNITVFIGENSARRFFTMDRFNGRKRLGFWRNETCDSIDLATEGMLYHQNIARTDDLHFFRKTLCRVTPVKYEKDVVKDGLQAYRYIVPHDTFHRPKNGEKDCYTLPGRKPHPNGMSEISPCLYGFPLAISFPHFFAADERLLDLVDGMTPDHEKHSGFVIVEPVSGLPLSSRAGVQGNLVMRDVSTFGPLASFSDMYIPLFWIEMAQVGVPWYVLTALYLTAVVLPATQGVVCVALVALGVGLLAVGMCRLRRFVHKYVSLDQLPQCTS